MRGIENVHTRPAKQARPITTEVIKQLIQYHLVERPGRSTAEKLRAWRTIFRLRLCQSGVMRFDEVMRLVRKDIEFKTSDGKEYMEVRIRKSKTDRKGLGITKLIPEAADKTVCMINLAKRYLAVVKNTPDTPLQQHIVLVGTDGQAKLSGKNICRSTADNDRKAVLEEAGLPTDYTEHSGRRGAAIALHEAGASEADIRRAGGWKTNASVERYINGAVKRKLEVAKDI